ncbi:unnamed protein product, partial [Brassica oleracea]
LSLYGLCCDYNEQCHHFQFFFALEIGCAVLLNTKVPLKIFLMKMKMLEKKQVVQEWSLQHQKNEVFDGIMEVWNKGINSYVLIMDMDFFKALCKIEETIFMFMDFIF